ncbi:MAG: hypothetical protein D6800_13725, partial [Candidatus Zixiibacteriota bacterium]
IGYLRKANSQYHPRVLDAMQRLEAVDIVYNLQAVSVKQINSTMIIAEDVRTRNGMLVVASGQNVTPSIRTILENYVERGEIKDEILVQIPAADHKATPVTTPIPS